MKEKYKNHLYYLLVARIIASNATRDHYGNEESTQGGCKEASEESCSQGSKEGSSKAQGSPQGSKAPLSKKDEHVS